MKKLLIIFLLLVVVLPVAGQNDSLIKKTISKNQVEFDIEFVAFSFGYNHRLYKNWFMGFNLGAGVGTSFLLVQNYDENFIIGSELIHVGAIVQYLLHKNSMKLVVEPKISLFSNISFSSFDNVEPSGDIFYGLGLGLFYGKNIQIGIKTALSTVLNDNSDSSLNTPILLSSSLLIIKIPIKW